MVRRCDLSHTWVPRGRPAEAAASSQVAFPSAGTLTGSAGEGDVFVAVPQVNRQVLPTCVTLCIACGFLNWYNSLLLGYLAIYTKSLKKCRFP